MDGDELSQRGGNPLKKPSALFSCAELKLGNSETGYGGNAMSTENVDEHGKL